MTAQKSQVLAEIWADPDWTKLTWQAQWLYQALLSQPQRDWAGMVPYLPMVWSDLSADATLEEMLTALAVLDHANFTVTDERTGEVLIRSYMRRNERVVLGSANTFKSAMGSVRAARSRKIRTVLLGELRRLDRDRIARLPSSTTPGGKGERPKDVYRRTMAILEAEQEVAPTKHSGQSEGSSSGSTVAPNAGLRLGLKEGLGVALGVGLDQVTPNGLAGSPQVDPQVDRPSDTSPAQDAQTVHIPEDGVGLSVGLGEDLGVGPGVGPGVGSAKAKASFGTSVLLGRGAVDLETTPARANAGAREDPSQDPSPAPVSPPPKDQTSQDPDPVSEPFAPSKIVEDWAARRNADGAEIRRGFVVALGRKAEDLAREDPQLTPARLHVALDLWIAAGLSTHQLGMSVDDVIGGPDAKILDPDRKLTRREIMELRGGEVPQPVPPGWWDQVALRDVNRLRARWRRDVIARRAVRR